jgi:hypothetical protein
VAGWPLMSGSTVIPPRPLQHPSHHLKTFSPLPIP